MQDAGIKDASQSASKYLKKRPVCAYTEVDIYKSSGDINNAAN
jgi:hypothetical protein